jgi:hypothetical protein
LIVSAGASVVCPLPSGVTSLPFHMKASLGVGDAPTRAKANGCVNQICVNMIRSPAASRAGFPSSSPKAR